MAWKMLEALPFPTFAPCASIYIWGAAGASGRSSSGAASSAAVSLFHEICIGFWLCFRVAHPKKLFSKKVRVASRRRRSPPIPLHSIRLRPLPAGAHVSTAQLGSLQRDTSLSTLLGFVGLASSLAASFPHVWIWKLRSRQRQPLWASVALSAGAGLVVVAGGLAGLGQRPPPPRRGRVCLGHAVAVAAGQALRWRRAFLSSAAPTAVCTDGCHH